MRLNVTSEIGKLKSVLVHLPGREIDLMVPPMMAQLLFDDILYGQVAREEHRRFQQLIRFIADEEGAGPLAVVIGRPSWAESGGRSAVSQARAPS